jgi:urease accessory protein
MSASMQLLRLMQLASPCLPVGAYAYSQGLEWAAADGVDSEAAVREWIFGIMEHGPARLDLPVLVRLCAAWKRDDEVEVVRWSSRLLAARETVELRAEEHQTGGALARLLRDLGMAAAAPWTTHPRRTYGALLALAGTRWGIDPGELCAAQLWAWAENQVAAAIKLVPLGQTVGQRILSEAAGRIPGLVDGALALEDWEIGGACFGQMLASSLHETQRTRLFRS